MDNTLTITFNLKPVLNIKMYICFNNWNFTIASFDTFST